MFVPVDFTDREMSYWAAENAAISARLEEIITACAGGRGTPALVEEWVELTARLKAVGYRVEGLAARRQRAFLCRWRDGVGEDRGGELS
ncbi:hypothetical protein BJP25_21140 [Actinokineospora bangkokensis]|uniref:Uncharacterized protein n=1 Tax=Actinokineospora bangkokensis TaxID=1193682 RepID=A0A1Q9LKP2_9PSEU|nr:hypothetical protein BJP25_21140 [Actinokineospora bangkokensis]